MKPFPHMIPLRLARWLRLRLSRPQAATPPARKGLPAAAPFAADKRRSRLDRLERLPRLALSSPVKERLT
ncbi:hypothetical protein [Chromobacterium violaceum]|uniref:hypothetical protein n=1 Tax=Chromobacterium violaceum TaxID=536 RepID=UPI000E1A4C41|nr:hypothetical protein [Chromobacterium violaceum]MBP4048876.1 hypothetical protein [Chromobacterium violaceum]QIY78861.1 hypothetical protein FOB43_06490 [Chromobacterium violaceum]QRO32351.1 hypothetical protein I6K04_17945 [Chromobacterium violaceum]QRQ17848.1 hypothetical protein I6K03_04785 [Chromobacterium violaceum]SUX40009.1 Uncharacterised protein [Chromobacterium violaceum]